MTSLKQRIQQGERVLGSFAFIPSPDIIEIMGLAGFDFVIIDAEHATPDWDALRNMIRAGETRGMAVLVRVPENSPVWIKHVLEAGAQGVMVPFIQTKEDAERAYSFTMYPPQGERGVCPLTRPAAYGLDRLGFQELAQKTNDSTLLIGIIEDYVGMDNVESIVSASPGLDVIYLGRSDLAASLGVPGRRDHPLVEERIQRAAGLLETSARTGEGPVGGMQVHDVDELETWLERGFKVVSVSSDTTILGEAGRQIVALAQSVGST
jgi:4-hydroxy-2-oxoheptanedioate aldolase